ncbi:MAG: GNAT family N-acetyltransferase [Rhodobacteraceae bacterium]|nr:GNAT family N-acetyltransferase [Paracoccaceae bacterium]
MSTAIHLAKAKDEDRLVSLLIRANEEAQTGRSDDALRQAYGPLLLGNPLGAVWLIGPERAPLGYMSVSFSWSVQLSGPEAWLTDIYVRPSVRRRGIGTEVVHAITASLGRSGVRAMHAQLDVQDEISAAFCQRAGLKAADGPRLYSDIF